MRQHTKVPAKVYLIGAGPGDPELITVKGLKALQSADVIMYDFLSTPELLKYAKKSAKKICVGKADGLHLKEQDEINQLFVKHATPGKIVVRLKGGDPFLFSHGIIEASFLAKHKIAFEIIPGVTSAFAAPMSFGIPLTVKGKFSSVAVLTGRKSNNEPLDAPRCDTLIYVMAVSTIKDVVAAILKSGRAINTPCAFVEKATTSGERIIVGTLKNIVPRAQKFQLKSPAVFIVGEVVRYGKKVYEHKYAK